MKESEASLKVFRQIDEIIIFVYLKQGCGCLWCGNGLESSEGRDAIIQVTDGN
jgi:hypothetical protein